MNGWLSRAMHMSAGSIGATGVALWNGSPLVENWGQFACYVVFIYVFMIAVFWGMSRVLR